MTALFFGSSERRLFGVHHRATAGSGGRHAVLLCYPGVQEYNAAHWVFRRLAGMLERAGHDVLRFDYYATGDSEGDGNQGDLDVWTENIVEAAAELRELSDARSVSVVGMRLGAALALKACTQSLEVRSLVLWEPVVTGTSYLSELDELHRRRNLWLLHGERLALPQDELVGYAFPSELRAELARLDMRNLPKPRAERVVIVAEQEREAYARLRDGLTAQGIPAAIRVVKDEAAESSGGQRERAKLSHAVLLQITQDLEQGAA